MFGENNNNNNNVVKIDISYNFIVKIALIVFGAVFLYLTRSIIAILLVSILLTTSITPFVDLIHKKKKLPRWLGIVIIYIGIIGLFGLVIGLLFPAMVNEAKNLIDKIPYLYTSISDKFNNINSPELQSTLKEAILKFLNGISDKFEGGSGIFKSVSSVVSGFSFFVVTLIMTFYMTMEEDGTERLIKAVVPKKFHCFSLNLLHKIQNTVGSWLKGQLSLSLIIGALCYIALVILGVNYSLLLALFAGLTEIIPYIGPVLGSIPAIIIAFTQGPIKGLFVIIIYVLIQQLENNFIVPKVMKKSVGLNPIVVIIVIMIGIRLAGIAGALLAVPFTAIIQVIANEFFHYSEEGIFKEGLDKECKDDSNNEPNIIVKGE